MHVQYIPSLSSSSVLKMTMYSPFIATGESAARRGAVCVCVHAMIHNRSFLCSVMLCVCVCVCVCVLYDHSDCLLFDLHNHTYLILCKFKDQYSHEAF